MKPKTIRNDRLREDLFDNFVDNEAMTKLQTGLNHMIERMKAVKDFGLYLELNKLVFTRVIEEITLNIPVEKACDYLWEMVEKNKKLLG